MQIVSATKKSNLKTAKLHTEARPKPALPCSQKSQRMGLKHKLCQFACLAPQSATRALHKAAMKLFIHCNYVQELVLNDRKCLQDGQFSLKAIWELQLIIVDPFPSPRCLMEKGKKVPKAGNDSNKLIPRIPRGPNPYTWCFDARGCAWKPFTERISLKPQSVARTHSTELHLKAACARRYMWEIWSKLASARVEIKSWIVV